MEILMFILGAVLGLIGGVFAARFVVKKEFEKNPPISEEMIGAMLKGAGQPATQKRINQIMKQMKATTKK